MKSISPTLWLAILCLACWIHPPARAGNAAPVRSGPSIVSIRAAAGELVVHVRVPAGQRRITLESRPRLGRGTWTPRAVQWSDGSERELSFRLPLDQDMELLQVQGEAESDLGLPATFFTGPSSFTPEIQRDYGTLSGGGIVSFNNAVTVAGVTGVTAPTSGTSANLTFDLNANASPTDSPRAVVESDIWKLDGTTLYFFNQQRGLQVVDMTHPDQPKLLGTLPLAVWGEQMYKLPAAPADGSVWLALLAQQACSGNDSEVLLVNVKDGKPRLGGRLPVRGQIRESRLVGDVLYVAGYNWSQPLYNVGGGGLILLNSVAWESSTTVQSFDLSEPTQPGRPPVVELAANPDAILATDRFLFVATSGTQTPKPGETVPEWTGNGHHAVIVFDISDPHGAVVQSGFLPTAGRVDSKFKMGLNGDVFTAVSLAGGFNTETRFTNQDGTVGSSWSWSAAQAKLETFSLANPTAPTPLGSLTLVTNESLYATRIVGDRAYVVTFHQVDPLWIVDLADPARPAVKGQLQVPGYSSYLQPLGDRLLALGVETGRTMVQLFDVADPSHPGLLAKVPLGEGWSWSEANSDEKAFQVFPDSGMLLVPWQGGVIGDNTGRWFQGIQLVDFDLTAGTLRARGVIDHAFQARRATLLGDRVISLSSQDVLTANVADRDHPQITADLELSPQVDQVFVAGDRLVQLRENGTKPPLATLALTTAPDSPLVTLEFAQLPIIGADLHGDRLAVLQLRADDFRYDPLVVTQHAVTAVPQPPLRVPTTNLVVVEIQQPPLLTHKLYTNVLTYPPIPGDPNPPPTVTNVYDIIIKTPQPPLVSTNEVVTITEFPVPPLWKTNDVLATNYVSVRVPGELILSIVGLGTDSFQLLGQTRSATPSNFPGGQLQAFWPQPGVLVWAESGDNPGYPVWGGGFFLDGGGVLPGGGAGYTLNAGSGIFPNGGGTIFFVNTFQPQFISTLWWPGWGNNTRMLVAFDVADPAAPVLASVLRPGADQDWNTLAGPFAADGKLFLGHRESKYIPPPNTPAWVTNADGTVSQQPIFLPGTWEHRSFLDVVDYSDPANPVVRTPVNVPGTLRGISHDGRLTYVEGASVSDPNDTSAQLHALAYDGLSASLVTSLPLPATGSRPLLVRADGNVLLGRAAATTNDVPTLETWAVNVNGSFAQYASATLVAPADEFHAFGDLLIVPSADRFLQFDTSHMPGLTSPGSAERPCNLSFDWTKTDATPAAGLWIPRGLSGLWEIPLTP